ncbi:DNA polymerase domain-containing protein [Proteus mirabilis]|uniref:DNA polymerase domain-containing protein n=1 Tax=Proteus mirabilis TaxID=584 RepID=UPI0034D581D0
MSEVKDFIGFDDIPNDVILEHAEELCMPTNNGGWSESEGKITLRGEIQLLEIGAIIQVVKSRIPDEKSLVEVVGSDNYDDVVDYAFSLFTGDRDFDELFTFSPGKGGRIFTIPDEVDLSFNELEALELILIEKCIEKHIEETGKEDGFEDSYDDFLRCAENWYNQSEDEVESEEIKSEEFDQETEDSLDSTEDILQGSTNFKYEDLDKSQKRVFDSYFERILSEVEKTSNGRKVNVEAVRTYCLKNFRDPELEFFNNIKEEYFDTTILSLLYLLRFTKSPPIITAFNTLFQNGDRVRNLPGVFLNYLLSERKKVKAEMFEYINTDRAKYNQLDLLQRIIKILANSYYGAFGSKSFIFFNPDIGPSITYQGQQIIITAILGFEGFAGNNVLIEDFNQYFNYIDNIMNEEIDESLQLSGITVSPEDVIKVTDKFCEFEMTKQEKEIIFDRISSASQTRLQKLYFTNNIWEFLQLPEIEDRIINEMICDNYFEADKIPEEIKEPVEWLAKMTRNFVFYVYPHENKTAKATRMRRRAVLLSDTDSTFINGRPFIDRICERKGWLKHELSNKKRCSIICIFTKLVTDYITDTYYNFTTNANVLERDKHRVNMKSE